jgi:hypothetical protein
MCNMRKTHAIPWTKLLGQSTNYKRYWDDRIIRCSTRKNDYAVLNYYLLRFNVDRERFDAMMTITACIYQLKNSRSQLKDILKDAKSNGSFYKVEVATARVEKIIRI